MSLLLKEVLVSRKQLRRWLSRCRFCESNRTGVPLHPQHLVLGRDRQVLEPFRPASQTRTVNLEFSEERPSPGVEWRESSVLPACENMNAWAWPGMLVSLALRGQGRGSRELTASLPSKKWALGSVRGWFMRIRSRTIEEATWGPLLALLKHLEIWMCECIHIFKLGWKEIENIYILYLIIIYLY